MGRGTWYDRIAAICWAFARDDSRHADALALASDVQGMADSFRALIAHHRRFAEAQGCSCHLLPTGTRSCYRCTSYDILSQADRLVGPARPPEKGTP